MTLRWINILVKQRSYMVIRSNGFSVKWIVGQMDFRSNDVRSNNVPFIQLVFG
jgi:hypothetical protein